MDLIFRKLAIAKQKKSCPILSTACCNVVNVICYKNNNNNKKTKTKKRKKDRPSNVLHCDMFHEVEKETTQTANHMLKVNNRNTRTKIKTCSKLTIKTLELHH